jgi:hypothetical protein
MGLKDRRRVLGRLIVVVGSGFGPSLCVLGVGKRGGCVIRHMQISQVYPVDGDFAGRLRAFLAYQARSIRGYDAFLRAVVVGKNGVPWCWRTPWHQPSPEFIRFSRMVYRTARVERSTKNPWRVLRPDAD